VNDFFHPIPSAVDLYEEGDLNGLDITPLGEYLEKKTQILFRIRGNIYKKIPKKRIEELAKELARIKVRDPGKRFVSGSPLQGEVDYEERRISDPSWKIFGILYEGVHYQKIISDLVIKGGLDFKHCIILFTNQLFGTWDRDDNRYHARVSLYGFPSLISLPGLVEAPAKPKEFYIKKQMGTPVEWLKEEYQGRFLDYGDLRTTEVLKGYAMQALLFHITGDPFCEDRNCRLFNSHWQEEVLHSQMDGQYEFCPRHEAILKGIRDRSREESIGKSDSKNWR
jgi:hypothetical protein